MYKIFTYEYQDIFDNTIYVAEIEWLSHELEAVILGWTISQFDNTKCFIQNNKYCFRREKNRTLFLLKWTK